MFEARLTCYNKKDFTVQAKIRQVLERDRTVYLLEVCFFSF